MSDIEQDADEIDQMVQYGASYSDIIDWLEKRDARKSEKVPQWIACSERLPTSEDADVNGHVWTSDKAFRQPKYAQALFPWHLVGDVSDITHWMPTGLIRPEPPQERKQ